MADWQSIGAAGMISDGTMRKMEGGQIWVHGTKG